MGAMTKLFIRLVPFLWFRLGLIHLWRLVPPGIRRRASRAVLGGADSPRERLAQPCAPLIVCGLLRSTTGFGWVARSTLRLAAEAGVEAIPLDLTEILARDNVAAGDPVHPVSRAALEGPGTLVLHFNPNQFPYVRSFLPDEAFEGKYVVASCAWELERVPAEWVRWLGLVDEIWAPSRFVAQAVANAGVRLPHRVVPPLLDGPRLGAPDRARFGCSDRDFVVLAAFSFGSGLPRKNPEAAVAAFRRAFSGGSARLILKVSDTAARPDAWARFREAHGGDPQIAILSEHLDDEAMWSLLASCDVVLSLHRAEGFGMVPAQGMLLGKAVVATGWSGNLDFMTSETAVLVPYRLVPVDDPEGVFTEAGLCWAEPDIEAAATALRRLHDDPAFRQALGAAAKPHMEQYLAGHRRSLVEHLRRIRESSPPPGALCGTSDTRP